MKRTVLIILLIVISFCLGFFSRSFITQHPCNPARAKQSENPMRMKKVTGIGGIFFKCKDPGKIKDWYKTHLGLNTDQYGATFEWEESGEPPTKGVIQWSPFSETDKYFDPSTKDFMINYRVENLVNLVEELKKEGVTIVDKIETYEYGKFVHIMDLEGNKIELWEPVPDYGQTDKAHAK
jgi:predicted enzyme related to lactoylglutathione lyase